MQSIQQILSKLKLKSVHCCLIYSDHTKKCVNKLDRIMLLVEEDRIMTVVPLAKDTCEEKKKI